MKGEKKESEEFVKTIAQMLEAEAVNDLLFAESPKKEGKSMEECCYNIIAQVEKSGRCGFADAEILGMAKHYWDEDNPGDTKHSGCRIVVNHEVGLSEEDKVKAREEAMRQLVEAEKKRMGERKPKPAKKDAETSQTSLFDL